jgi:hypothetical protein
MSWKFLTLALLLCLPAAAADDFTIYDLLAPETHQFAIIYDVTVTRAGAKFFFNPIRPGSTASQERVLDRATGQDLAFETVKGKDAKATGEVSPRAGDEDLFLKVTLAAPVPKDGQTRLRIFKTYTDAPSYSLQNGLLVFDRPLGIKRNVVILPLGWELVGSASPGIVSTDTDGRLRLSFVNDRDDSLPVKITARRLP